jgi:hypothetical protein
MIVFGYRSTGYFLMFLTLSTAMGNPLSMDVLAKREYNPLSQRVFNVF